MIRSFRSPRIPGHVILLGCLLVVPQPARAGTEIVATRKAPSSLTGIYGSAVPVHAAAPGGTYVIPTRNGLEFRGTDAARDTLYGSFRTAGVVEEAPVLFDADLDSDAMRPDEAGHAGFGIRHGIHRHAALSVRGGAEVQQDRLTLTRGTLLGFW